MKRRQNIWNLNGTPTSGLARALNYGGELTSPGTVEDIRKNADKKAQAAAKKQANALAAAERQAAIWRRRSSLQTTVCSPQPEIRDTYRTLQVRG